MGLLPFSGPLARALMGRHTEYLQRADAGAAATGIRSVPALIGKEALGHVLTEVFCNMLYALRAMGGGAEVGDDLRKLVASSVEHALSVESDHRAMTETGMHRPAAPPRGVS